MKRILAILAVCVMMLGIAACAPDKVIDPTVEDTENLYIYILERGYGSEWLVEMAKAFEEKTRINTDVFSTSSPTRLPSEIKKGPTGTDADIFFNLGHHRVQYQNYSGLWEDYPDGLLDLTELYGMTIPGENVTFGDKMVGDFRKYSNQGTEEDPKYYTVPWASGIMGLTYNIDVFKELYGDSYEDKLPNTTKELYDLAVDIKNKGGMPFIFAGQLDYFSSSMMYDWWAQYEGIEEFENFFKGRAYDENYETYVENAKEIFRQTGRFKSIEALSQLISYDAALYYRNGYSYGEFDYKDLQVRYLTKANKTAMMPNGDWLETENDGSNECEFGMMKTPVLSAITEKLDSIEDGDDETLSLVIDYVDGNLDEPPAGVSETDIEKVRIARNITASNGLTHSAYVPQFTNAKANVFRFFLFMASDEGLRIYKEYTKGGFLPFKHDYTGVELSTFEKDIAEQLNSMHYVGELNLSPLFYKGGLSGVKYSNQASLESRIACSPSSANYLDAQGAFEAFFYSDTEWELLVNSST